MAAGAIDATLAVHRFEGAALVAHVEGEIMIQRPVEEVFDFVAGERNEPRHNRRMDRAEKISPGAIAAGTRFRAELKAAASSAQTDVPARQPARSPPGAGDLGNLTRLLEHGDAS